MRRKAKAAVKLQITECVVATNLLDQKNLHFHGITNKAWPCRGLLCFLE